MRSIRSKRVAAIFFSVGGRPAEDAAGGGFFLRGSAALAAAEIVNSKRIAIQSARCLIAFLRTTRVRGTNYMPAAELPCQTVAYRNTTCGKRPFIRSEEHPSELQSRVD